LLPSIPSDGPQAAYTLAVLRLPLSVDNFECIAVRPGPRDGRYIYLLSDNNQNPQQRTLLLQFYAPDIAASDDGHGPAAASGVIHAAGSLHRV
jgi:hypothetical protein